ncbi:MAG: putative sugar O-methyltransferase [Magnetovibrionaceae bacterium]
MLTGKDAIWEVVRHAETVDRDASSHWRDTGIETAKHPLGEDPFNLVYGDRGFGIVGPIGSVSMKTGLAHRIMHGLLQTPIRAKGSGLRNFAPSQRIAKALVKRQGRAFDKDVLRHSLTMALCQDHLDLNPQDGCFAVIGDGFGTMSALILDSVPGSKVILANLSKTLLVDLAFLYKAFGAEGIAYADSPETIKEATRHPDVRIIGVRADDASLLREVPIQLAFNLFSMMEMDPPVTAKYFEYLRQSPAERTAFYCCNRDKVLPDGTETRFLDYPWDEADEILVDGPCPWTKLSYHGRPPFYYHSGHFLHRLAWLKKA